MDLPTSAGSLCKMTRAEYEATASASHYKDYLTLEIPTGFDETSRIEDFCGASCAQLGHYGACCEAPPAPPVAPPTPPLQPTNPSAPPLPPNMPGEFVAYSSGEFRSILADPEARVITLHHAASPFVLTAPINYPRSFTIRASEGQVIVKVKLDILPALKVSSGYVVEISGVIFDHTESISYWTSDEQVGASIGPLGTLLMAAHYVTSSAVLKMRSCAIHGVRMSQAGSGAAIALYNGNLHLVDTEIYDNSRPGGSGGTSPALIMAGVASIATLENCRIHDNDAGADVEQTAFGAIGVLGYSRLTMVGCDVFRNRAQQVSAVGVASEEAVLIMHSCRVYENVGRTGALSVMGGKLLAYNTSVFDNNVGGATHDGVVAGITVNGGSAILANGTRLANNMVGSTVVNAIPIGGSIYYQLPAAPAADHIVGEACAVGENSGAADLSSTAELGPWPDGEGIGFSICRSCSCPT